MICKNSYTAHEMEQLYSAVEDAVASRKPIDMLLVSQIIKPGDFYLRGDGSNGLLFRFDCLKWYDDGKIYGCLIQPQNRNDLFPEWFPVITYDVRTYSSSGDLSMIRKENRFVEEWTPGV